MALTGRWDLDLVKYLIDISRSGGAQAIDIDSHEGKSPAYCSLKSLQCLTILFRSERQRRSKQLSLMTMLDYFPPAALLIANAMSTVNAMSRSPRPIFPTSYSIHCQNKAIAT